MKKNVDQIIADSILSKPLRFEVGGQQFSFYPPSLGQVLMTKSILASIGYDNDAFVENTIAEAMRLVEMRNDDVMKIIAINLMTNKEDVCNVKSVDSMAKKLSCIIDRKEVPTLLIAILSRDNNAIDKMIRNTELKRDRDNMQRVMRVKNGKNSFVFGRRTMYGQVIDVACARYGWTFDYVLWGISYMNLQMLMADQEVSVFLSDKELKEVHISNDRDVINADDPKNQERIKAMFND